MTELDKKKLVRRCLIYSEPIAKVVDDMVGGGAEVSYKEAVLFLDKVINSVPLRLAYAPQKESCYFPEFYFKSAMSAPPIPQKDINTYSYIAPDYKEVMAEASHAAPSLKLELSFSERLNLYVPKR